MKRYRGKYSAPRPAGGWKLPTLVVLTLLLLISVSAVLAYYISTSQPEQVQFLPAQVSCQIEEEVTDNVKSAITVKNTSNVEVYIRVKLSAHWETPSGNIVALSGAAVPGFTLGADWEALGDDTYFYTKRVAAGVSTGDLLGSPMTLAGHSEGYVLAVTVLAEAIQADGMDGDVPAVQDAWKVTIPAA